MSIKTYRIQSFRLSEKCCPDQMTVCVPGHHDLLQLHPDQEGVSDQEDEELVDILQGQVRIQPGYPALLTNSGIKMNSLKNLAMNITINCTIQKARRTSSLIVLSIVRFRER